MSNKNRMVAGKMNRNHFRFSIRKLSIGAASVLLGLGFAGVANQNVHAATTMTGTVHVNPVPHHPSWKILLWDGQGHGTGKYISGNTNWKVFEKKSINGIDYYRLGTDRQWVQSYYVDASGATELGERAIYTVGSNSVALVDGQGNYTGATLPAGSRWKAFAKKTINGAVYYRLGTERQWARGDAGSLEGNVADEGSYTGSFIPDNNNESNPSNPSNPSTPSKPSKPTNPANTKVPNLNMNKVGVRQANVANDVLRGDSVQAVLNALHKAYPTVNFSEVNSDPNADGQVEFKRGKTILQLNGKRIVLKNTDLVYTDPKAAKPTYPSNPAATKVPNLNMNKVGVRQANVDKDVLRGDSVQAVLNALHKAYPSITFKEVNGQPAQDGDVMFRRGQAILQVNGQRHVLKNTDLVYTDPNAAAPTTPVTPTTQDEAEKAGFKYPAIPVFLGIAPNAALSRRQQLQIMRTLRSLNPQIEMLQRVDNETDLNSTDGGILFGAGSVKLNLNGHIYNLNVAKLYK